MSKANSQNNPYALPLVLSVFALLFNFTSCLQACSKSSAASIKNFKKGSIVYQGDISPAGGVLGPINIPDQGGLYGIFASHRVIQNGDYCSAVFTLTNNNQQDLFSFGQEFFFEEGVETGHDEDGPWSERYSEKEDKAHTDIIIHDTPIYIKVETELPKSQLPGPQRSPIKVTLFSTKPRPSPLPHGIVGLLLLVTVIILNYKFTKTWKDLGR